MPYYPSGELVAIHWLKGVTDIPAEQVGTVVPDISNSDFADNGFVQVSAFGGKPDDYTFMQNTTIQIDTWAFNENSNKAPWGKAANLTMLIKRGVRDAARLVTTPSQFHNAYVHEVRVLLDPRRILNDEAGMARYSFDLVFHWSEREIA